ncbi:hypothetical protein [Thalassobacillus sp. CUG 92003]|uniref:hypothetical protein n=1 Tax=Thalassobacillus sp. CUG 92003 TaxID=2736641 RepID=UPI0015E78742|nr:hypothetical protein [Thalassobacillus sp. CUG 92003]
MNTILRYKILSTERVSEDRRIHVFDMKTQQELSFNLESLKRTPANHAGIELSSFLKTKQKKIELGLYDREGRAS